jgi:hypothetical protein
MRFVGKLVYQQTLFGLLSVSLEDSVGAYCESMACF